ncbi:pilus assembly PilX N-terminal domain-containing protein [Candidatus Peregrinibacteria bacterium]|nr:pilus assembly PilX N-terminal domain-containing protein [Candidatus Peregrinibacteria bacterium]
MKRGSALLITLLLMGALLTITLGISTLVLREIHVTQSVVDANKVYYSAEAGVERALLGLSRNGAGYEPSGTFTADAADLAADFKYQYLTSNTNDSVPGFGGAGFSPEDKPVYVEPALTVDGLIDCVMSSAKNPFALAISKDRLYKECPRATYRKLALNETHIIPLFSTASGGGSVKVEDFIVQYYLNVHDGSGLWGEFKGLDLQKFDVLRWKLYGKPAGSVGAQRTESIADFYPGINNNGPLNPVCIGTNGGITSTVADAPEKCIFPVLSVDTPGGGAGKDQTLWSAARECYLTDAGSLVTGGALIKKTSSTSGAGCEMRDFINSHEENYLVLTNMVNPNIVGISNIKDPAQLARADIYYRVLAKRDAGGVEEPKLVKDYAEITSTGFAKTDSVAKTLNVRYKAPGFLPVFNFSLYKTTGSDADSKAFVTPPSI